MGIFDKRKAKADVKTDKKAKKENNILENPTQLASMSSADRKNRNIVLSALKSCKNEEELEKVWKAIDKSLKSDIEFLTTAVKTNPAVIKYIIPDNDSKLRIAAYFYKRNSKIIEYLPQEIQEKLRSEDEEFTKRQKSKLEEYKEAVKNGVSLYEISLDSFDKESFRDDLIVISKSYIDNQVKKIAEKKASIMQTCIILQQLELIEEYEIGKYLYDELNGNPELQHYLPKEMFEKLQSSKKENVAEIKPEEVNSEHEEEHE